MAHSLFLSLDMPMGIVEVVRSIAKRVNFKLGQKILGYFLQQPIQDQAAFNATLRMQDEDDLGELRAVQLILDNAVALTHVIRCVAEIALNKALQDIEDNAGPAMA
jgi:hypothetical protein